MDENNTIKSGNERLVTGLILLAAAALITAIDFYFENHFLVWLALGAAAYFAFCETMKMLELEGRWLCYYGGIIWAVAYFYPNPEVLIFGALVILLGAMTYNNNVNYKLLFPLLYPLAPMLFIFALAQSFGIKYLVWLVFIVGMTDTAAYYIGKSIGVTPFSPVSPKKTWEGFYAGVSAGTILGILFGTFFIAPITPFAALVISFFVSMASVFGDLFESYLKRKAGVKDSGDILPGHGGMLDRVDGYLFGAITMVILLRAFVN